MSFKICTIGCGSISSMVHGPSYKKYALTYPDVELTACCDLDEEKAALYKETFKFSRYYTDFIVMLDKEKPDAVCLIVPEKLTASMSIKIMERGYPVIMEKPPGLDRNETMGIIRAAEKYNIPNQIAFNRRYTPLVKKLKGILGESFKPEELHNIRYDLFRVKRMDEDFAATAIHGIDTVKFLAGSNYRNIRFEYQEFYELGPNVANIFLYCEFESGTRAQLNFCPVTGVTFERATINAFNNTFLLELPIWCGLDSPGRLLHILNNEIIETFTGNDVSDGTEMFENNGFYAENVSFFDDIREGRKPEGDVISALQSVEVADFIRKRKNEYRV